MLLLAFVITELRMSDPVLDLRLFLNSTFTMSNKTCNSCAWSSPTLRFSYSAT